MKDIEMHARERQNIFQKKLRKHLRSSNGTSIFALAKAKEPCRKI